MLHTIKNRRSIYALGNDMPMSQEALDALIRIPFAMRHRPLTANPHAPCNYLARHTHAFGR